jgi:hypothetical protein
MAQAAFEDLYLKADYVYWNAYDINATITYTLPRMSVYLRSSPEAMR